MTEGMFDLHMHSLTIAPNVLSTYRKALAEKHYKVS